MWFNKKPSPRKSLTKEEVKYFKRPPLQLLTSVIIHDKTGRFTTPAVKNSRYLCSLSLKLLIKKVPWYKGVHYIYKIHGRGKNLSCYSMKSRYREYSQHENRTDNRPSRFTWLFIRPLLLVFARRLLINFSLIRPTKCKADIVRIIYLREILRQRWPAYRLFRFLQYSLSRRFPVSKLS